MRSFPKENLGTEVQQDFRISCVKCPEHRRCESTTWFAEQSGENSKTTE